MSIQLPEPINNYFDISNGIQAARIKDCFTTSATVQDERGNYQGLAAIESWLHETREKYQFNSKPINFSQKGSQEIVVSEVSGNFPGSPILLNFTFVLSGEKIQSLEIN